MARGAVQKKKGKKAQVQRPPKQARSRPSATAAEQTLFFIRLRRQAKWVFVFLAVVFALGFVIFGVGSGGGVGLGDLFSNSSGTKGQVSASEARKKIAAHPRNAKAYSELATALETEGKLGGAIAALKHYTKLVPKNTDALIALGGLYTRQANELRTKAQAAQAQAQEASAGSLFEIGLNSPKTNQPVVPQPEINQTISTQATTRFQTVFGKMQSAYTSAEGVYKRLAKQTSDPQIILTLGQVAQQTGDTTTAVSAYKRFINLAPHDPTVPLVRQQLKQLRSTPTSGG
jgi:tetratricopeptide (TPR) repeat protein